MRRLGQQIVKLRNRLGMSQEQLAHAARLTPGGLDGIEQGLESPSLDVLMRIAISLKAEPWELLALPYGDRTGRAENDGLREYH